MKVTERRLRVPLALVALLPVAAFAAYDSSASYASLPGRPFFPEKPIQCATYARESAKVIDSVRIAHDACLTEGKSSRVAIPADPKNICSKPICQALHDNRDLLSKTADELVQRCQADVAAFQKKGADREKEKQARERRAAESSPCARDRLIYTELCTGRRLDSRNDSKNCEREQDRLRLKCERN